MIYVLIRHRLIRVCTHVDNLRRLDDEHADACVADNQELAQPVEHRGRVEPLPVRLQLHPPALDDLV